ncbi:MAG: MFS transporter [Chthonomonas sp.]|nr:MFS transporter [Chthonomonas sp.]
MFRVLEITPFRRLLIGQAVSQFGDMLYMLMFLYMVQRLTGNAMIVGWIGAVQALPPLLLSPYAGVLADRVDRRTVLLGTDLCSAALMLGLAAYLTFDATPPLWLIFASATLLASVNTFFLPAKSAAIPRLVPADRLQEANSLSATTQHFMPLLGLAISAAVLGQLELLAPNALFPVAAACNGLTFLVSARAIWLLPQLAPDTTDREEPHFGRDLREGWQACLKDAVLWVSALQALLVNLFIAPFMVVHLAVNKQWFDDRLRTVSIFESAFIGAAVIMALMMPRLRIVRPGMAFIGSMLAIGVLVACMAFAPWFYPYLVLNFLCGLALPIAQIPMQMYFQTAVPDALRGRVHSFMTMSAMVAIPLSNTFAGVGVARLGVSTMFLIMGGGMILSAAIGLAHPQYRRSRLPSSAVR